jgi:hypothetical protein
MQASEATNDVMPADHPMKGQSWRRLVYPMLGGICALPHVRKEGSPQRHRGTEQKSQVIDLIFFSVSLW